MGEEGRESTTTPKKEKYHIDLAVSEIIHYTQRDRQTDIVLLLYRVKNIVFN